MEFGICLKSGPKTMKEIAAIYGVGISRIQAGLKWAECHDLVEKDPRTLRYSLRHSGSKATTETVEDILCP